ncbi:hypothetical protein Pint_31965 [Pistacia integerrima]|uniref:Uncharacterized protein n=1 Tax=Pistacia integerrima TaxID=434235 RepID=A0ACC0XRU6_9ROSI|nr:hypothetical protein Pint_31965 [Pistacia integerrima]
MAWRELLKKSIHGTRTRALAGSVSTSAKFISDFSFSSLLRRSSYSEVLTKEHPIRCFHASPELLARRRNEESGNLKTSKREKKGKFKKRTNVKPPVEAAYVPPKPKKPAKFLQDKPINIFEGMTIIELAKQAGQSIATLQDILINVGEKVQSEFDPLSIDVAELVAMVFSLFLDANNCVILFVLH